MGPYISFDMWGPIEYFFKCKDVQGTFQNLRPVSVKRDLLE
jgi:hypothetical protein